MIRTKEWTTPQKDNQEILALTAEIKALKEKFHSGENDNCTRNAERSKNAWRKITPKDSEPHSKVVN